MNKLMKLIVKFSLKSNMINTTMGIIMIVALFFVSRDPKNQIAVLTAFIMGGLLNISNGLKLMKTPKKMSIGMSALMLGIILIIVGFIVNHIMEGA